VDLAPLHRSILSNLPASLNIWASTTPSLPSAVLLFGRPTESEPMGWLIAATQARSVLSALAWITETLGDVDRQLDLYPGWIGPPRHVFALEWTSERTMSIAGWSAFTRAASVGVMRKPPHPEFPPVIDLIAVAPQAVVQSRRDLTLTLISNLDHLEYFQGVMQ